MSELRKGQIIFTFLEWLKSNKGFESNQGDRMADPFYIPDEQWDRLWKEFSEWVNKEP